MLKMYIFQNNYNISLMYNNKYKYYANFIRKNVKEIIFNFLFCNVNFF